MVKTNLGEGGGEGIGGTPRGKKESAEDSKKGIMERERKWQ